MRFYLIALCTVAACNHQSGQGQSDQVTLKASLDLKGVIGFAIASTVKSAAPADGACMPSTLYAISADGTMTTTTVTEVVVKGGGGTVDASVECVTSMQTETATALFDTQNYVVVDYNPSLMTKCGGASDMVGCTFCSFVVLRKSHSELFCGNPTQGTGPTLLDNVERVEGDGDILYLGPHSLVRLDMSTNPPTQTIVDSTPQTNDDVSTFEVNSANDVLAYGNFGVRVFKENGGLVNIEMSTAQSEWVGGDGDFYFTYNVLGSSPPPNGQLVEHLTAGSYAATLVGNFDATSATNGGFALATATQAYGWEANTTANAIIDFLPSAAGSVCRSPTGLIINGPLTACTSDTDCTGTCGGAGSCSGGFRNGQSCLSAADCTGLCSIGGAQHVVSGIATIKNALGFGSDIYIQGTDAAGNGAILDVNAGSLGEDKCCTAANCCPFVGCCSTPATATTLLAAGAYSLSAISLSRTGELTFAGLRNADGAHVVGNCAAGMCTVLNASAPTVTALQRIN